MEEQELLLTPLHEEHLKLKARMIPFDGFDMPVQYTGIIEEHFAVREKIGLFDVSHMGEIEIKGKDALPDNYNIFWIKGVNLESVFPGVSGSRNKNLFSE